VFLRSTRLLDALEAGDTVVVGAWQLTGPRVPAHMRPGSSPGGCWWRVSPDDAVVRAESPVVDRVRAPRRSASPKVVD
jgi:hypothetical protein